MVEILETLEKMVEDPLSWSTLVAIILLIARRREHLIRSRERAEMRYYTRLIAAKMEVPEWSPQHHGSISSDLTNLRKLFSWLLAVINQVNPLRRIPMLKLLTTSAGRKVVYLLLAAAVTFVNNKFGLNLNQDTIFSVWGGALALMQLEAHFNMKQFISGAINALSGVAQSATTTTSGAPIQTVIAPPMTQQEATEMLKELSTYLQPVYDSVSSGKMTDATLKALNSAMAIRDYLKQKGA